MVEIERVWLLTGPPTLPASESWTIEQGYQRRDEGMGSGARLRRAIASDGTCILTTTIKRGHGLVREETEERLTEAQFELQWPSTLGRRLRKLRHRVQDGELVWEVDQFSDFDLWLAEVELPTVDTEVSIPSWLVPHIAREVTLDRGYRNSALALRGLPTDG